MTREGTLIFTCIHQCFDIIKLQFTVHYFRNFEESEDELRNEVLESLEKLTTSKEAEKREEVSGSSKDNENLREGTGMQKYAEINEGLENISTLSDDKICVAEDDHGAATTSQNIQV